VAVVNVTARVRDALRQAPVRQGLSVVSVSHTTCGLCVNEDEEGLKKDIVRVASLLLEPLERQEPFRHDRIDNNARAHLTSIFLGHSLSFPIADGELHLGTWQNIFLLEMDGPRTRRLEMLFLGE
jgi:secondary thiamine-phosphate synthase enzyme